MNKYTRRLEIDRIRKKIRRGTATPGDMLVYSNLSGNPADKIKKETDKQRSTRLEKQRVRSAKNRASESGAERKRRLQADSARQKLRRTGMFLSNEERLELEERLKQSSKRWVFTGWHYESPEKRDERLSRRMNRFFKKRKEEKYF
jgi:hypothetical protein